MKKMAKAFSGILLTGLLAGAVTGCGSKESKVMDTTVGVATKEAETGSLKTAGTYVGIIENTETVNVVSQVSGTVKAVKAMAGDRVKKGEVICKLDDTEAKISVREQRLK